MVCRNQSTPSVITIQTQTRLLNGCSFGNPQIVRVTKGRGFSLGIEDQAWATVMNGQEELNEVFVGPVGKPGVLRLNWLDSQSPHIPASLHSKRYPHTWVLWGFNLDCSPQDVVEYV